MNLFKSYFLKNYLKLENCKNGQLYIICKKNIEKIFVIFLNQNDIYEYEDNDHILTSSFSIDNFEDREILDALEIVGDIKRIYKIKWAPPLASSTGSNLIKLI